MRTWKNASFVSKSPGTKEVQGQRGTERTYLTFFNSFKPNWGAQWAHWWVFLPPWELVCPVMLSCAAEACQVEDTHLGSYLHNSYVCHCFYYCWWWSRRGCDEQREVCLQLEDNFDVCYWHIIYISCPFSPCGLIGFNTVTPTFWNQQTQWCTFVILANLGHTANSCLTENKTELLDTPQEPSLTPPFLTPPQANLPLLCLFFEISTQGITQ